MRTAASDAAVSPDGRSEGPTPPPGTTHTITT
nr:MAG TPA: hypothetical protein [Caudoviricetes sp.]